MVNVNHRGELIDMNIKWDKAQYNIIKKALNSEDSLVVKGGPGTGKSLLSIEIAKRESKRVNQVLHLMYNVPLSQYVGQCTDLADYSNIETLTYHKWIYKLYRERIDSNVPEKGRESYDSDWEVDWDRIERYLEDSTIGTLYDVVITDETQDFPEVLIRTLRRLSKKMICFIDTNQSYEDNKTSIDELLDALDIKETESLSRGYRTTKEIMEAANVFALDKKDSSVPNNRGGKYPRVICCDDTGDRFDDQNRKIISIIKQYEGKDIGVLVNNEFMPPLKEVLDLNSIEYSSYRGGDNYDNWIDFTQKGVKLVSFGTMKGLEFDIVIIPNVDLIKKRKSKTKDHNLMYVAMTRAKEELFILYRDLSKPNIKWGDAERRIRENKMFFDWNWNLSEIAEEDIVLRKAPEERNMVSYEDNNLPFI